MVSASREQNSSAGAPETEQLKMDHSVTAQSPPSDNDSGERPVRQQLKETNLDSVGENSGPARANRKRSLDNTDGAADTPPTKRSRECTPDMADIRNAFTEDNTNHAGIPESATSKNVSDDVATALAHASFPNTKKVQFPLDIEIKVSICGSEQISHLTIPVEIDVKVTAGTVSLASSTSGSAEVNPSKPHITIPSEKPIPPPGEASQPIPPPGSPSPGSPSPGSPFSRTPSPRTTSPGNPSLENPSSAYLASDYYEHDDPSFHIYEEPEPIEDSSSEDSLPDYCSDSCLADYPSSSPYVPYNSIHPDHPIPTVEAPDSNYYQYPQNLEATAYGNEDDSSQNLKKKRSREQLEDDASKNSHAATGPTPGLTETTSSDEKSTAEGQPEKKRPRDNSEERKAKIEQTFTASAFGKAAATSPFAMPATKSTSDASPFATTGASTTGFGALGSGFSAFGSAFPGTSGKLTSFASPNAPGAFSGTAGKLTSFASANAPTSFAGTTGKLTSFASPNAPVSFGEPSDKTLGAKQSDDEESDNEVAGERDDTFVAEKTDERFHEQPGMDPSLLPPPRIPKMASDSCGREKVETGEENETTKFTAKGKLYYFDDKKWKERGIGTFKVNLKTESNGKKSGRIIMRADGALRVMLNSAIWHSMPFGDSRGARPTTRDIYLASTEDERVVSLLLRLGSEKPAGELYDVLNDILEKI
ncbi:uncharacterized protein N7479_003705 [Penicillium vulpinum]|uniref:RanBD1 domain-containing protein n=1 Tax=Penicillium vulpinum TaxID=29845 RepID=A0A1V6RS13_9EURO|nr:uncharacterized protein N7479_003705 [Penicillium vulpinum]KAJ5963829.1 hypothetical protein N7479_003705 [Penicillium vulpinum]OQE04562.1 hypothetical protein PENVUL_c032G02390 [Penicillium vulpinum]